jgi:hypothetical protein
MKAKATKGIPVDYSPELIISGVSAIFSGVAIFVAIKAMRLSDKTSRRMVEIEEARDHQANKEGVKASLSAEMTNPVQHVYYISIRNRGPANGRDIKVFFDGKPASEYPAADPVAEEKFRLLAPGAIIRYELVPAMGPGYPLPDRVRIEWSDDSGEHREWESDIS